MTKVPVFIEAAGIVTALGKGLDATVDALLAGRSAISPLQVFTLLQGTPLPVGQVPPAETHGIIPRSHRLAREALELLMQDNPEPPDAVILGCTTGGVLTTETLLRNQETDKAAYQFHGLSSVTEDIAQYCQCQGAALTVSTACSSGAVAIAWALQLLRAGRMERILVGGVDSLCRLTYFGFHSLQLVDSEGCHPLDFNRKGLAVAEGAALLMLTSKRPPKPLAMILGAGLSCDAHHATAPQPEGKGARAAMQAALEDSGLTTGDIDYINLHGTGTPDNDLAESKAITALFVPPPALSSIKGATGHSLAASGAIEAVVSALAINRGFIPGNTGLRRVDPSLDLIPQPIPQKRAIRHVLSNSFGFGGNNGSIIFGAADETVLSPDHHLPAPLAIHGRACLTGAGGSEETFDRLEFGNRTSGIFPTKQIDRHLPARLIRRLKRLSRLALFLASKTFNDTEGQDLPSAVFMGTGWGALSETYDFLERLTSSEEQFPSPTDFIGSVHNSPAGQAALLLKATGANVTTSGGDFSFEQALLAAESLLKDDKQSALLLSADEAHPQLSPRLDPSIDGQHCLADGGGALYVNRNPQGARCLVRLASYQKGALLGQEKEQGKQLVTALGGAEYVKERYAAVLVGVPAAQQERGEKQLAAFFAALGKQLPACRYRQYVGEFASASAVAAVLAVSFMETGKLPGALFFGKSILLSEQQSILVLGTGTALTAMEFFRP